MITPASCLIFYNSPMNIILFGYRGSGKTSIGRLLAGELWKTFVDLDAEVCKQFQGRSIADIWATDGEPAFRGVEAELAKQFCAKDDQVIALGGGTLTHPDARAAVQSAPHAVRIYLKCKPEILHQRIQADPATSHARPSLTRGASGGGGLDEVRAILAEREPIYTTVADKVFDVTHLSPKDAVPHIIKRCL